MRYIFIGANHWELSPDETDTEIDIDLIDFVKKIILLKKINLDKFIMEAL